LIKFLGLTTSDSVEQTLSQFRNVAGDRFAEIIAPSHQLLAAEYKEGVMPKVVWGYAIGWDLVEVAPELKVETDKVSCIASIDFLETTLDAQADDQTLLKRSLTCRQTSSALKLHDGIFLLLGNSMVCRQLGRDDRACTYKGGYCKVIQATACAWVGWNPGSCSILIKPSHQSV
jgi:hypothetical protein